MSDYEDSASDGDLTRTFKEVDASFIVSDARKSLGRTFDPRAIVDESDLSVSDDDEVSSPMVATRHMNIRRLISSDDSSENDSLKARLENHIEEISSDSESASNEGAYKTAVDTKGLSASVIVLSSEEDEDFVVSPSESMEKRIPKIPTIPPKSSTISLPYQKPVTISASYQKPETISPSYQKPETISPSYQKPETKSPPYQKLGAILLPNQKPQTISPSYQKPAESFSAALAETTAEALLAKISEKKMQYSQFRAALKASQPSQLPDGGQKLRDRMVTLSEEVLSLEKDLAKVLLQATESSQCITSKSLGDFGRTTGSPDAMYQRFLPPKVTVAMKTIDASQWNAIRNTADIQHGFGAKALKSYTTERGTALATLSTLHGALKSRPGEDVLASEPRGLRKDTQLMPHQRRALAWLAWREKGPGPYGGILADDMGLGKTLTMISLVMNDLESPGSDSEEDNEDEAWTTTKSHSKKSVKGGTLVICPASLLSQWEGEVRRRIKSDRVTVEVHHGPAREKRGYRLARRSIVVSTYAIARTEHASNGALHHVRWRRVILDEAHVVRNHKSKTAEAVFALNGKFRWCLTGTPVHNKELDLFALIKFIGCKPFDDVHIWKRWIDNKGNNGAERLSLLLGSLLLRRTKTQLQASDELKSLGTKELHTIQVTLTKQEAAVYEKILAFSKSMFAQFLLQRHEREAVQKGVTNYQPLDLNNLHNQEVFQSGTKLGKMADKYANMTDIKSHVILVLLLRLRQICVHPTLVSSMLEEPTLEPANDEEDDELAGALGRLKLRETEDEGEDDLGELAEDEFWNLANPVFDGESVSSKMRAVLATLLSPSVAQGNDKAVVVSQWVSMLNLLENTLRQKGVSCVKLCGETLVKDRMKMVDEFNDADSHVKVMLLSLTAGGVGLNLVGANHLLLCDLHWNPQLEAQASDRVFRVGQTKPVHIYKFVCKETIEENIHALQDRKMAIATNVLTGARDSSANKLSVDDLKMLFDMK